MLTDVASLPSELGGTRSYYLCHGIQICSDIELPGLLQTGVASQADQIFVQVGDFEKIKPLYRRAPEHSLIQYKNSCYRLTIPELGGISIQKNLLLIHPISPDRIPFLLAFLMGTGLAVALAMRGVCALHMSVVCRNGKTIAFGGPSGTGKSTAALWFCKQAGASLVADDVARLDLGSNQEAWFHRGIARVRLWKDSLDANSLGGADAQPEAWRMPKYSLKLNPADEQSVPAGVLIIPTPLPDGMVGPTLQELQGFEKVKALTSSLYRPDMFSLVAGETALHEFLVSVVSRLPVYRFHFSRCFSNMEKEYRFLSERFFEDSRDQLT